MLVPPEPEPEPLLPPVPPLWVPSPAMVRRALMVGELKAACEKLDGHYRAFVTYLNAVQELQPEESLSKAAQYYNADLAKIDLQYQQSRKKGGKEDEPTPEPEEETDA
ncbi:MAG: hypothetical protein K6D59_06935 [Bacteroidales bacterium]|nr:hypothetical protein [Bacteroidales bacterium]